MLAKECLTDRSDVWGCASHTSCTSSNAQSELSLVCVADSIAILCVYVQCWVTFPCLCPPLCSGKNCSVKCPNVMNEDEDTEGLTDARSLELLAQASGSMVRGNKTTQILPEGKYTISLLLFFGRRFVYMVNFKLILDFL